MSFLRFRTTSAKIGVEPFFDTKWKGHKERLLEAAFEIFARDGYVGTYIKDIAEAVGIVKSALYRHFDSKEAIWDAVIDRIILNSHSYSPIIMIE